MRQAAAGCGARVGSSGSQSPSQAGPGPSSGLGQRRERGRAREAGTDACAPWEGPLRGEALPRSHWASLPSAPGDPGPQRRCPWPRALRPHGQVSVPRMDLVWGWQHHAGRGRPWRRSRPWGARPHGWPGAPPGDTAWRPRPPSLPSRPSGPAPEAGRPREATCSPLRPAAPRAPGPAPRRSRAGGERAAAAPSAHGEPQHLPRSRRKR